MSCFWIWSHPWMRRHCKKWNRAPTVRNSAIVILIDDPEFSVTKALHSGVRAVIQRMATAEEIVAAIQASVAGLVVLHADALHSVLSPMPSGDQSEFHPLGRILSP